MNRHARRAAGARMRCAIDKLDAGERLPDELEAEAEEDSAQADELDKRVRSAILAHLAKYPNSRPEPIVSVLVSLACLYGLGAGLDPDEFTELVRASAVDQVEDVARIRERARRRGQA